MAHYYDGQFDGFDDFGRISFKKRVKKIGKGFKTAFKSPKAALHTIGKALAAPLVVPTAIGIKATTYTLSKTKIKPFVKLERKVGRVYRGKFIKSTRDIAAAELAIGAAVVGAVYAAPAVSAAVGSVKAAAGAAAAAAAKKGVQTAKEKLIEKAVETGKDVAQVAAEQVVGAGAPPEEVAAMPPEQQVAAAVALGAPKTDAGKVVGPAAGALLGFLIGGPIGAAAGAGAGFYATRKKK